MTSNNKVVKITPPESTLSQIENPVICPEESCKKIFLSKSVLNMHFTQVHEHTRIKSKSKNISNPIMHYHCPIENCIYYEKQQKHFAKFKYVKQHFLKVHAVCKFSCDQCNKKFAAQSLLNAHLMYCDLNLICSCGSKFIFIESLLTHVRRTKHKADILKLYYQRRKKKKLMRSSVSKGVADTASSLSFLPQVTAVNSLSSTSKILPKPQSRHIIAALALSEMAFAGLQRLPSVDVGVQTEFVPTKRLTRKSMSPIRSKSPAIKRKQTTETETQTRLTNLKNKRRKAGSRNVTKCSIGLTTDSNISLMAKKTISKIQKYVKDQNVDTLEVSSNVACKPKCAFNDTQTVSFMHLSENFDDSYSLNFNTSGTQTSHRVSLSTTTIPQSDIDNINCNLFDNRSNGIQCMMDLKAVESIPSCSRIKEEDIANAELISQQFEIKANKVENNISIEESPMAGSSLCSEYESKDLLIDEDENYETLEDSSKYFHINSHARRVSFSQIRSSSIETQTDHDVFLSNIQAPDDADYIILTSSETQTDHDANSLWCTSETQTCEEFSDIEQFLCSTIHTQTHDENKSNELFPELNFTADTQTQTNMDDSPLLITTHTQTSVL